jgi:3D (Asp-Asp-Asp) domain-containing protein
VGSLLLAAASLVPLDARPSSEDEIWDERVRVSGDPAPDRDLPDDVPATEPVLADDDVEDDVELSPGGIACDPYACWLAAAPWAFVASTSAYAWGCGASGPTRSGTRVRWGVVAVDPRVIPLGSELEIEGFMGTTFIAEDTGGAVRGNRVDIYFPQGCQAARVYGRQPRAVRLV